MAKFREFSSLEVEFLIEVLESAHREFEELEEQLEWYICLVPEQIEEALAILRGDSGDSEDSTTRY